MMNKLCIGQSAAKPKTRKVQRLAERRTPTWWKWEIT